MLKGDGVSPLITYSYAEGHPVGGLYGSIGVSKKRVEEDQK